MTTSATYQARDPKRYGTSLALDLGLPIRYDAKQTLGHLETTGRDKEKLPGIHSIMVW